MASLPLESRASKWYWALVARSSATTSRDPAARFVSAQAEFKQMRSTSLWRKSMSRRVRPSFATYSMGELYAFASDFLTNSNK